MVRIRLVLACAVAGATGMAWAEVVPWLYDADVAVASQSDTERRTAAGAALVEVLTRVTGLREIPFSGTVDAAIRGSERYYVRYGFARRAIEPEEAGGATTETRLEIHFESNALLDLLRRAGLPVWSADRPSVLVWVVLDSDDARRIVAGRSVGLAQEVTVSMRREARRRGVVLTFPLVDLEDRELRATDLWGRFWTAIIRASQRYSADLVLLGRVSMAPAGRWTSRWELKSTNGEQEPVATFAHHGASVAVVAGEAVHRLADALARRYAVRGGDRDTIALTVRGAQTVRGYAAVLAYLQSREYIDRVDVSAVEPDALYFKLQSTSPRDQLMELLLMGGYLSDSRTASPTQPLAVPSLELTWMGVR